MQRSAYLLLLAGVMFANGARQPSHARVAAKLQSTLPTFKLQADPECKARTVTECAAVGAACDVSAMEGGTGTTLTPCDYKTGDCQTDMTSSVDASICVAWTQPGATCTSYMDCQNMKEDYVGDDRDYVCYNGKCTDASTIAIPSGCRTVGDECDADADCVTGLKCSGGVCDGRKMLGESCDTQNFANICVSGLRCFGAEGTEPKCTKVLANGAAATLATSMLCQYPGFVVDGKCAAFSAFSVEDAGQCLNPFHCKLGSYCSQNGVCVKEDISAVGAACNSSVSDSCGRAESDFNELMCVCDMVGGSTKCQSAYKPCAASIANSLDLMFAQSADACGNMLDLPEVMNGNYSCVMPQAYLDAGLSDWRAWSGACGNRDVPCNAVAGPQCVAQQQMNAITVLLPRGDLCGVKIPITVSVTCSPAAGVFPAFSVFTALCGALLALLR